MLDLGFLFIQLCLCIAFTEAYLFHSRDQQTGLFIQLKYNHLASSAHRLHICLELIVKCEHQPLACWFLLWVFSKNSSSLHSFAFKEPTIGEPCLQDHLCNTLHSVYELWEAMEFLLQENRNSLESRLSSSESFVLCESSSSSIDIAAFTLQARVVWQPSNCSIIPTKY